MKILSSTLRNNKVTLRPLRNGHNIRKSHLRAEEPHHNHFQHISNRK